MAMATDSSQLALLRLLQLTSPALPVGAYAYSQGLETAVEHGWVTDEAGIEAWLTGLLRHPLCHQDVPLLARLYRAWVDRDAARVAHWNAWLYASREAAELQREDQHLGTALARLLAELDLNEATHWRTASRVCFATLFSLAAARWGIALETAVNRSGDRRAGLLMGLGRKSGNGGRQAATLGADSQPAAIVTVATRNGGGGATGPGPE